MTQPDILERLDSPRGELVLRRHGDIFEIISNGVFLMDSRDGRSERLLVRAALDRVTDPRSVLIAGLGVGFSLRQALADSRVAHLVVAEIEPAIVTWHRSHLATVSAGAVSDPRVTIVTADVVELLGTDPTTYDAICLDVDNGPDWTLTESNAWLYSDAGTKLLTSRLTRGGVLSVWGAAASPAYDEILGRQLEDVRVLSVAVARGEPDVVWVGRRPHE